MLKWTDKAKQHAYKLRASGTSLAEIAALTGRTRGSVKSMLQAMTSAPRGFYNRNEVAALLGLTLDEFMRHQEALEKETGMPQSTRARYAVPRISFNQWLHKHYFPQLTVEQWVDERRAAFLKACFTQRPDEEIIRAARLMQAAESLLDQRG